MTDTREAPSESEQQESRSKLDDEVRHVKVVVSDPVPKEVRHAKVVEARVRRHP